MTLDPETMRALATAIAQEAGAVILAHSPRAVRMKGERDPVTEADLASERLIVRRLRAEAPGTAIFAEEETREVSAGQPTWFVDPLDGTVNFSHGHPFFAVSLALYDGARPVAGVVHAPRLGETFAMAAGCSATLNGQPLAVSGAKRLLDALLATGFAYRRNELAENNVGHFSRLVMRCRDIRRGGSAALDLAYVAAGRLDGHWEPHLQPWDVAAGAALVLAAGGVVTDMEGGADWLRGGSLVAAGAALHPLLLAALQEGRGTPPARTPA
ncbi:MAG: inositol monophosphatase family protein [Planctomycetota bacterium]